MHELEFCRANRARHRRPAAAWPVAGRTFSGRAARELIACDQISEAIADLPVAIALPSICSTGRPSTAAARRIVAEFGVPDVLVNNAGWTRAETMASLDADKIGAEVDLNLTGVMAFTTIILEAMVSAAAARSSSSHPSMRCSISAIPAYAAAKAGINAYARAIAVEMAVMASAPTPSARVRSARRPGTTASTATPAFQAS